LTRPKPRCAATCRNGFETKNLQHSRSSWDPAGLEAISKTQLKRRFQELYGRPPPAYIRRRILLLAVGYALQEQARGGPDSALSARLLKLDAELADKGEVKLPKRPIAKPGTQLLRQWQGVTHTVTVTAAGFTYRDRHYRSLSAVARRITGTQWSGPKFFGIESGRG
jgi:hypothetical protein